MVFAFSYTIRPLPNHADGRILVEVTPKVIHQQRLRQRNEDQAPDDEVLRWVRGVMTHQGPQSTQLQADGFPFLAAKNREITPISHKQLGDQVVEVDSLIPCASKWDFAIISNISSLNLKDDIASFKSLAGV
eukprot:Skav219971  [mRNA]  locus=scaffold2879:424584:425926:- [translate_table: standard]